jgi:hypothetical protein
MDPIHDFHADVEWVLETCQERVASYPPPLDQYGHDGLERHWLLKDNSGRNSIAYLLPFWLQQAFDLDHHTCRLIAVGNTFWLLYFFAQDEVIDASPGEYKGHLLPLGNLLLLDALAPYRSSLGSTSPFWPLMGRYIAEWAESVSWEREEHWGQAREFAPGDLLRLARKAAPLKIPCAALSLLADREEAIGPLEEMIDNVLVAFQLADDLRDWRDDLARGIHTYFLTRVMVDRGIRPSGSLTEEEVEKSLFVGTVLDEAVDLMAQHTRRAIESISVLHAPYLKAYLAFLEQECLRSKEGFQAQRSQWIKEQFAFLLDEPSVPGR